MRLVWEASVLAAGVVVTAAGVALVLALLAKGVVALVRAAVSGRRSSPDHPPG